MLECELQCVIFGNTIGTCSSKLSHKLSRMRMNSSTRLITARAQHLAAATRINMLRSFWGRLKSIESIGSRLSWYRGSMLCYKADGGYKSLLFLTLQINFEFNILIQTKIYVYKA